VVRAAFLLCARTLGSARPSYRPEFSHRGGRQLDRQSSRVPVPWTPPATTRPRARSSGPGRRRRRPRRRRPRRGSSVEATLQALYGPLAAQIGARHGAVAKLALIVERDIDLDDWVAATLLIEYGRSAAVAAASARSGKPRHRALADQVALEFDERAEHVEDEPVATGRRVDALVPGRGGGVRAARWRQLATGEQRGNGRDRRALGGS